MRRVYLRGIEKGANFAKSEATLWDEWRAKYKIPMRRGNCVLFVSCNERQLLFVFGERRTKGGIRFLDSLKWRLLNGACFSDDRLQDCANEAGVHLEGIKYARQIWAEAKLRKSLGRDTSVSWTNAARVTSRRAA